MLRIIDRSIRQLFALKGREAEAVVLRDVRARGRARELMECVCVSQSQLDESVRARRRKRRKKKTGVGLECGSKRNRSGIIVT